MGRSIDEIPDAELATLFLQFFGLRRAATLTGYAVLWSVMGVVDDVKGYRQRLIEQGLSRSAAFEATEDMRRFREWIEVREIYPWDETQILPVLRRISKLTVQISGQS